MRLSEYIGIPFKELGRDVSGCDCWGLLRLYYKNEKNIELDSYTEEYINTNNARQINNVVKKYMSLWDEIPSGQEQFGDGVLIRLKGYPMHVGIILQNKMMLHILTGTNSVIEKYNGLLWKNRVVGFFRYAGDIDG